MKLNEQYRRDNELVRAGDENLEVIMKALKDKTKAKERPVNTSRRVKMTALATAACLVLAAVIAIPLTNRGHAPADNGTKPAIVPTDTALAAAQSYEEIYSRIEQYQADGMRTGAVYDDGIKMPDTAINGLAGTTQPATSADFTVEEGSGLKVYGTGDYSKTNTQVADVDESDCIKTDGRYIYRRTGIKVVIIDAESMSIVSEIEPFELRDGDVSRSCGEMYLAPDRLVLLYTKYTYNPPEGGEEYSKIRSFGWVEEETGALVYDVSDPADPKLLGDMLQDGFIVSSRVIDGRLYLITTKHIWNTVDPEQPATYIPTFCENGETRLLDSQNIAMLPAAQDAAYTVIGAVDVNTAKTFESVKATFGATGTVYADTERIILTCTEYKPEIEKTQENGENVTVTRERSETRLVMYALSDGTVTQVSSGVLPGTLLNQFSLDRYNGVVRAVVTDERSTQKIYTDGIDRYEYEYSTTNALYTLDESLRIMGSIEGLAEDERVYSVRFMGDTGYFVTFRQVDPLFAVDLSDPAAPKLLSALKIPGFSDYLHPYGEGLLFGFGRDADEKTGRVSCLKLSMFDISDPANVTECAKLRLEEYDWSEALNNHKAMLINKEKNIIAFPAEDGYLVYGYSDGRFEKRGGFGPKQDEWWSEYRGLFIGDSLYICSEYTLLRYSLEDFSLTGELVIREQEAEKDYYVMN